MDGYINWQGFLGHFCIFFFLLSLIWQSLFLYYTSCLRLLQEIFFVKFLKSAAFYSCHPYSVDGPSNSWKYHVWSFLIYEKRREKILFSEHFMADFVRVQFCQWRCRSVQNLRRAHELRQRWWCLLYYVYLNLFIFDTANTAFLDGIE